MKHKFLSLVTIGLLAVVSCTQEDSFLESRITHVSAELPDFMEENGTRSQINVSASDSISYSWAIGDVLGIFPDEGDQVSFRLTSSSLSADGKNATFDGGAWALKNGHTYYSYFPFSYENFSESSSLSAIPVDYTGQSITEWGDTKNAGKYDFNAAGGTSSNSGALSFQFQRLGALLRLKLTLPATATYQKLTLSTDASVIPVKGKVNLSASTIAYIPQTYASSISVNLNNISGTKDQIAYVYLMLPPMTLLTQNKLLTATLLYNNGSSATYNLYKSGNTTPHTPDFTANTIYRRDAVPQGINPGGEMSDGDEEGGDATENGHAYVDLGLSVKWATCNVGASSPEEYGDYYAWGETETKSYYDWSTYKWCKGSYYTLTKYCTDSELGTVDNKTVMDPEDDVAHVKWGGSWRMPTKAEMTELFDNCTWRWTTQGGTNGWKVTSKKNGNSVFLPAAGYCSGGSVLGQGDYGYYYGYYWSSTPNGSLHAYNLYFNSGNQNVNNNYRYFGSSVRPVCSENDLPSIKATGITLDKPTLSLSENDTYTLSATISPSNVSDKSVVWSSSDPSVVTVSASGVVTAVKAGTATITVKANDGSDVMTTCTVTVIAPENTEGEYNGHAYVDLGLSVKWATCNVGASSPEDYGDYYAWGETETKSTYDWGTYKWCNGSYNTLTKYCTDSSYGTVDNKTVLDPEDDVAQVKWGGSWRMPTKAEMTELYEKCNWTWTTQGGKNGYKVTSKKNGKSIFLPAAGDCVDGNVYGQGDNGLYWSSTPHGSNYAYDLYFDSGYQYVGNGCRYDGFSVRPVCSENDLPSIKATGITLDKPTLSLSENDTYTLSATISPSNATDKSVAWSSSDPSVVTVSASGVVTAVKAGTATITVKANDGSDVMTTCTVTVIAPENTEGEYNGHAYVDLGLSVKWATCNVGASSPEEYGDHYAWGETETKSTYDWNTYKWCEGSENTLTKYCTSSSYGTVDNKKVLESSDDVAQVKWGSSWRMPTEAEMTELHEKCIWTWTTQGGTNGYKVTSKKNGNSVFLPAAGHCNNGDVDDQGRLGDYWSSTPGGSYRAYGLGFGSGGQYLSNDRRDYGYSVRAVLAE